MTSENYARIRIYELIDGEPLSSMLDFPLSHFGTCPNVGDTLCLDMPTTKFYSVSRRYYVRMKGWAIVVREVPASPQIDSVMRAWKEDDDWDAEIDAEEEAERLEARRKEDERRNLIFGKPPSEFAFDYWEEPIMQHLAKIGVNKPVRASALKGLGDNTRKKLERRGFIAVQTGQGQKINHVVSLTSAGAHAWKALLAYRKRVEAAKNHR
ncbi:hypothetical protein [Agrobacterium tumefaciens]|jgi:hypothetical protein|uniref:hypothetical protein n=1 Tax=Agrobacterium tumefaciens TaxID=358 RepID=UPI001571ECC8|nr:hypothetical protein [Agrobacterium tumefaciens]